MAEPGTKARGAYLYLCCGCGEISPASAFTPLKWDEEHEHLVPIEPGDTDPILRCPRCDWEHTDDDANPGLYDGDRDLVEQLRQHLVDGGWEWPQEVRHP
jgi:hypothetical protein